MATAAAMNGGNFVGGGIATSTTTTTNDPAGSRSTSVFDTYSRGIRGNVVRGVTDVIEDMSADHKVLRVSTILSYVITAIVILLFIGIAFKFNYTFIMILAALVTIVSIYQSIVLSSRNHRSEYIRSGVSGNGGGFFSNLFG